jgi:hypothetical protein
MSEAQPLKKAAKGVSRPKPAELNGAPAEDDLAPAKDSPRTDAADINDVVSAQGQLTPDLPDPLDSETTDAKDSTSVEPQARKGRGKGKARITPVNFPKPHPSTAASSASPGEAPGCH